MKIAINRFKVFSAVVLAVLFLFAALSPALAEPPRKSVLLLYSYGHGSKGVDIFDDGMVDTLFANGVKLNDLYFEYLDLERYKGDPAYLPALQAELERKYPKGKIDLIMTGQQPALKFLLTSGANIAPGATVITFQGQPPAEDAAGGRRFFCILAKFDVAGTVTHALELFPKTKKVIVVVGDSEADRAMAKTVDKAMEPWKDRLEFEYTTGMALDGVLKRVSTTGPDTVILFTQFNMDAKGLVTVAYEVEGKVVKAANAPVFGLYDFNLKNEGVGGSVVSVEGLGVQMANLMLDLMAGRIKPEKTVNIVQSKVVPFFDWAAIKRWGGNPDRLPADAVFKNRGPGIWETYRWYLIAAISLFFLQSAMIGLLLEMRRRKLSAEKKQLESEERFRTLFDQASDSILLMELEGAEPPVIREVNESATKSLGFSRDELIGKSVTFLEDPATVDADNKERMAELDRRGAAIFEVVHRTKNGELKIFECNVKEFSLGQSRMVLSAERDVTERRRSEEMIALDEARLESLLRISQYDYQSTQDLLDFALGEAINLTQSRLGYLYFYDEARREFTLVSWSKEVMRECAVLNPQTIYALDKTGVWGEAVRQRRPIMMNDFNAHNALKKGFPQGHVSISSFLTIPVFVKDSIVAVVGVADKEKDYTEADVRQLNLMMDAVLKMVDQARAEQLIQASEAKFRNLLENIYLVSVILDTAGNLTFCNDYLLTQTGWTRDEIIGKNWFQLFLDEKEKDEIKAVFDECIANQSMAQTFENSILTKSGDRRLIHWSNTLLRDPDGKVSGLASIGNDITEHRRMEEQLRQAVKMEAIGTLAGGIAHDFNNILGAIMGYTDLTVSALPAGSEERDNLQEVLVASRRAKNLVQQILAFSRKKDKQAMLVDASRIVGEALNLIVNVIPKTIRIEQHLDSLAGSILADPTELHQVVINLCTNAYQAMSGNASGVLSLRLSGVTVGQVEAASLPGLVPGNYVRLEVEDTGPGMDEATQRRIFEPYFTTKEHGKGTGLGLATVHGIVTGLGGAIALKSAPGMGSVFTVYLPRQKSSGGEQAEQKPGQLTHGKGIVLLLDDEPGLARLGKKMLESLGYTVKEATDPLEALRLFESDPNAFDVIVTDQTMPGLTGAELLRRAKATRPTIPAVLCTGYSDLINEESAPELGIQAFVRKPFDRNGLAAAVALALAKEG